MEIGKSKIYLKCRPLVKKIYQITSNGKFKYDRSLADQMRRASVSVISNLVEGYERDSDKEFHRFLSIAKGSCGELKYQLIIASDIGYIDTQECNKLTQECDEIMKMIGGLKKYLNSSLESRATNREAQTQSRVSSHESRGTNTVKSPESRITRQNETRQSSVKNGE